MKIKNVNNPTDIALCYDVFLELRPHLKDKAVFVAQVLAQQKEGYTIAAVFESDEVVACTGYRIVTMLAWGRILYIDDLVTRKKFQGKGYASVLLRHVIEIAKEQDCAQVHLDTGFQRHAAHKLYAKHGFEPNCHHLALKLSKG